MAKTVKRKAKVVREGQHLQIPAQTVVVRMKAEYDHPTIKGGIYSFKLSGMKGPLRGQVWDVLAHSDEEFDLVLRNPPVRRLWDWFVKRVWGS